MHRTTLYPPRAQQPFEQRLQELLQQGQGNLKDSRTKTQLGLRSAFSSQEHSISPDMLAIGGPCHGQTLAGHAARLCHIFLCHILLEDSKSR